MQEIAEVIEDKGQSVLVKIERHSACKKCDKKNCGLANHDQDEVIFEINKDNHKLKQREKIQRKFKKGEMVKLEMKEGNLIFSALIVYLFPLIALVMGYFITDWLNSEIGQITEGISGQNISIFGSLIFLGLSFLVIRKINNNLQSNKNFEPKIVKIMGKK